MDSVGRSSALSGLAFAVLFSIGSGIWVFEQPSRDAESGEIVSFFEHTSTAILIGGTVSLVSLVFLVWFGAIVRDRLHEAEGDSRSGLPLLAFAGTVLTAAVGLGAETFNMAGALSAEDGQLTNDTAQIYFDASYAFGAHAASVTIAMIAVAVALTALRTGKVVPRPAAWAALMLGVALLTPAMLIRPGFLILYTLAVGSFAALSLHLHRRSDRAIRH